MTKSLLQWSGKALLAGLLALALLCLFCVLYYNVPVHYANADGSTEYKWEPSRFYSRGTEGFALGRTNNDGFNNLRDYTPGDPIDVLLMGSSHMEGFNTAQRRNTAVILNDRFAGEKYVYNIGTAGHTLLYCVKHLGAALDTYAPGQYVILETDTLSFAPADMDAAVDGTLADIPSHTGGLITLMQKLPYLRLLYTKYLSGGGQAFGGGDAARAAEAVSPAAYTQSLGSLLDRVAAESQAHGVTALVVYHPALRLLADGTGAVDVDPAQLDVFRAQCELRGIVFVDVSARVQSAYDERAELAYGFSNTAPGIGHINALGHRLIAEALYDAITAQEG
ncbi:MAG: hypothetical protein IJV41_09375 [Oscillospiraceae bacterium]|nr:hypothetical protein [Oscillospiraceae bacterium]